MRKSRTLNIMCKIAALVLLVAGLAFPSWAQGPFAYVTNQVDGTVSVIDTSTNNTVVGTPISLPSCGEVCKAAPAGLAVTPDGKFVYVAIQNEGTVVVIDTSTNMISATIPMCTDCTSSPVGVAITPDGTRAYVTDTTRDFIEVIDTNSSDGPGPPYNTVTATIMSDVGNPTGPIAISPDGLAAYYTFGTGSVGRIDTATNSHTTTITVGTNPTGIAVTPDTNFIYVTNKGDNTVSVIPNTFPNFSPITTISVSPLGSGPYSVAITPNGQFAYVVNQSSNNVSVISTTSRSVVTTITESCLLTLNQIAITPDGTQAYVADSECDTADVILTASNTAATTVPVGNGAFGVAIRPAASTTFITPQQAVFPGATVTFTDDSIITETITIPADANMNGTAFKAVEFIQVNPTVLNATRLTNTTAQSPNWSGGITPIPAGTTCTVLTNAGGNCVVVRDLCFDANHVQINPCDIISGPADFILLNYVYNTLSQPIPGLIIADDNQNNWAVITSGFTDCCTLTGRTNGLNTDTLIVSLGTDPFSAFVGQPINSDGSSVFSAKRGVVPVKFTLTLNNVATCALPPATIALTRTAGGVTGTIDESTYLSSADSGSNFRISSCQYIYNLATGSLGAGTYRVDISIFGAVVGSATFALR